ncbi:GlxA family transcriptional regulator [Sphingomonas sp. DT-51]
MAHRTTFYLHPGFQLLDLAGPIDAMATANELAARSLYETHVVSRLGKPLIGNSGVCVATALPDDDDCGTLVVVGGDMDQMVSRPDSAVIRLLSANAARIASICTGAFALAEAGVLDGRRVTTHWARAQELAARYPALSVEPDSIFVADGPIWTSAGITAGIDLALALIDADHGHELARAVARELVVYHRRPGGQSQFAALSQMDPSSDRMRAALTFAREHLAEPLPLERLAEAAALSPRQFGRIFRRETGETPAKAIERLRVEAARLRLQDGSEPVEQVARAVGFQDPERMRRAFIKRFGQPPQAIRRAEKVGKNLSR